MRFEHEGSNLVSLPDDLVLLGQQLSDDSDRLADRYPSASNNDHREPVRRVVGIYTDQVGDAESHGDHPADTAAPENTRRSRLRWTRRLSAAAALMTLAAGIWAFRAEMPSHEPSESAGAESASHSLAADSLQGRRFASGETSRIGSQATGRFGDTQDEQPTVVPAAFFENLSGPEQEALLDLLEDQGMLQASLSI